MKERVSRRAWWLAGAIGFILLFQWWNRYAGAPMVGFVVDDWRLWKISLSCPSFFDALMQMLNWPDRPLGTGIMMGTFYLFGDSIAAYVVLESLYTALFLLAGLWAVYVLTRDWLIVVFFGVVFSLLPNLTESFQWHTMTASYGLGYTAYLLTVGAWASYLQRRSAGWLVLALICFAFALGSYEIGILLPGVLVLLGRKEDLRRMAWAMLGFGLIVAFYLVWKFTDGMGTLDVRLFPKRSVSFDWAGICWNVKECGRWWLGSRMLSSVTNGLNGFLTLPSSTIRLLAVGNLLFGGAVLWVLKSPRLQKPADPTSPFSRTQLILFASAWVLVTNVLTFFSWNAGRMNYLPGVGVALLVAMGFRWMNAKGSVSLLLVMLVCMMANQGTSAQWRDSGRFHSAMYSFLEENADDWQDAEVVLFDTAGLRNRLTSGLLAVSDYSWGSYGNAVLMRGAFFGSMMGLVAPDHSVKTILLDMEYGAVVQDDVLHWHGWYDSSVDFSIPLADVYRIDCQEVGGDDAISLP